VPSPPEAPARVTRRASLARGGEDSVARRGWSAVWPRVATLAVLVGGWHVLAARSGGQVPGPAPVAARLWTELTAGTLLGAIGTTLARAAVGFLAAVVLGLVLGAVVASSRSLRAGVGGLLAAVQTVPSVAWFPVALVLLAPSEGAILAVVVLGAAPAVAMGLLTGVDRIPPVLHRAGHVLGAHGFDRLRHVILPGALPGLVGGLTQGWAFAWRALMAGELLVALGRPSLGTALQAAQREDDATGLFAAMVVVVTIGLLVDEVLLRRADRAVQRRWGLQT
jgi:NitT/TauT family transport system permease protein